jgi:hypothetical protein
MAAASKIVRVLDMLEPEHIADVLGNKNEMARNSFELHSNTVDDYPEFYATLIAYYRHHFAHTVSADVEYPEDMAASEVQNILQQSYQDYGGYEGAYYNARTGKAGGMTGILNAISRAMRERQEHDYTEHVLRTEIDPMNFDEHVELMKNYLDRFGGSLPPSVRTRSAYDLARNYDTILRGHARVMSAVRGMVNRV